MKKIIQLIKQELEIRKTQRLTYDWEENARNSQIPPPGDWRTWLILAGRGFGKTRTGAETLRSWVKSNQTSHIALIGKNLTDVVRVMVEGQSGLLNVHPLHERPIFEKSKRQLIWPNGAKAQLFGGDYYDQLRGPQFDGAWVDELCKFKNPKATMEQLFLGLRLGNNPRCIITTTPKPSKYLENLLKDPLTVVTRGSTFENAKNLAKPYLEQIIKQFEGFQLGAQELHAQILTQTQGALWNRSMLMYQEPSITPDGAYELKRIVIAIDPATTHHEASDETGIVVVGIDENGKGYLLEDLTGRHSPATWAEKVVEAYKRHKADRVIAEVNKGGDLVERVIQSLD